MVTNHKTVKTELTNADGVIKHMIFIVLHTVEVSYRIMEQINHILPSVAPLTNSVLIILVINFLQTLAQNVKRPNDQAVTNLNSFFKILH